MTIGFNSEYLLDFLKASNGGEVRLEFKDAQSAGQMRPDDAGDDGSTIAMSSCRCGSEGPNTQIGELVKK